MFSRKIASATVTTTLEAFKDAAPRTISRFLSEVSSDAITELVMERWAEKDNI